MKTPRLLLFSGKYSTELCLGNPNSTFVFGDNLERVGMGGQAIIRNCPNVYGVPTKRSCSEYMHDTVHDMFNMCVSLNRIDQALSWGLSIVLPITPEGRISLGCGLANLPYYAPVQYAFLEKWFANLCIIYPTGDMT